MRPWPLPTPRQQHPSPRYKHLRMSPDTASSPRKAKSPLVQNLCCYYRQRGIMIKCSRCEKVDIMKTAHSSIFVEREVRGKAAHSGR